MKMKKSVLATTLFTLSFIMLLSNRSMAQLNPELVFRNPVLVSGTALKEGAVYKFSNVTTGVDAHIKLKKFSRKEIVMATIDNNTYGWDKAFQPEFGLPGIVQPYQNWYVDFEMSFYKAGTKTKHTVNKITATALDVDGDGTSVSEYYLMRDPDSVKYAPNSYLTSVKVPNRLCDECGKESDLKSCTNCNGTGNKNYSDRKKKWEADDNCKGTGKLHTECGHAFSNEWDYDMRSTTQNFTAIDTLSTQVMATYIFMREDDISFRIGAMSGAKPSHGGGIRLNSLWFRSFSLMPPSLLPVKLTSFAAALNKQTVTLDWSTANEEAFSHFEVERSIDGKTFSKIGIVTGKGGLGTATYAYKDAQPAAGKTVFYRIRMVDLNEPASYSSVASIRVALQAGGGTAIAAYPNPTRDEIKISMPAAWQGKAVSIAIYNNKGIQVHGTQCPKAGAVETLRISHLPKGMYIVTASTKTGVAQQMIYKD